MQLKKSVIFALLASMLFISSTNLAFAEFFVPKKGDSDIVANAKESYNKAVQSAKKSYDSQALKSKIIFDDIVSQAKTKYSDELSKAKN